MATEIKVPTTGNAGEPAVVLEWHRAVGDEVRSGELLCSLETAKAVVEVTAPETGTLLEIRVAEGDDAPEHETLAVLGAPGERAGAESAPDPASAASVPATSVADAGHAASPVASPNTAPSQRMAAEHRRGRVYASPRAKALAQTHGIDVAGLAGSGPFGRIVIRDVVAAVHARSAPAAVTAVPAASAAPAPAAATASAPPLAPPAFAASPRSHSTAVPVRGARKVTAQRMHASLQQTAQVTLTRYAGADALLSYASRLKEVAAETGRARIGVNDLLLFATARAVAKHPALNSWFEWDAITRFEGVDLGFAVDTGQALLVPVVAGGDTLPLGELAARAQELIAQARDGRLGPEQMAGGTFTVSNLGGLGVHWFTPVLNPPQSGILGIGAVHRSHPDAPALLPLSLTFDHRAIDGAAAAAALADIARTVEIVDVLAAY